MQKKKPLKMYIYQPLFIKAKKKGDEDEYVRSTIVDDFPYFRVEVGYVFTTEKRPAKYHELIEQQETKVEAVRYNLAERACIVILERKTFKNQRDVDRYVSGKISV